jgi:membrane protein YqaA with SNARE-associated domain
MTALSKKSFLHNMYERMISYATTPAAERVFCFISFIESSFFPLPPDLMMIPMIVAEKTKAFRLAFLGTVYSVLGGMFGYAIGYFLYKTLGSWIINAYGLHEKMVSFQTQFDQYGFWIIALKGLTPIPFKLVTIASGVAQFNFVQFLGASIIARAFRFYLLAAILWFFGPAAKKIIEKYLTLVLVGILGIIVLGFFIVKWIL